MTIYLVVESWTANGESGVNTRAFKSKKDGEDYFVGKCYEARIFYQNVSSCEDDIYTNEKTHTTYFSIYEEGFYERNHTDIQFQEIEVN